MQLALCLLCGLRLHASMQAPTDAVLARVNISDTSRGAVFPPMLRFTPQDWAHPKARHSASPGSTLACTTDSC